MENISVEQFRHKILLKLCLSKLSFRSQEHGSYRNELLTNVLYATNEVVRDLKIKDVVARIRGNRIFVFYLPLRRIVFEVGIDAEKEGELYKKPNIWLINLKGIITNSSTIQSILDGTKRLGAYKKKGGMYGAKS